MSREENLAAQERFGAEVANGGNIDAIDELVSEDFVDHDPAPDQGPGVAGFKDFWRAFRTAFPDLAVEVEHLVADEDNVAFAYRATGTHQGPFVGIAATGRGISVRGVQISKFADGRLVERWGSSDELGILRQLGIDAIGGQQPERMPE